jgi:hypothetical protein
MKKLYLLRLLHRQKRWHHFRPQAVFVVPKTVIFHLWIRGHEKLQSKTMD